MIAVLFFMLEIFNLNILTPFFFSFFKINPFPSGFHCEIREAGSVRYNSVTLGNVANYHESNIKGKQLSFF